MKKITLLTFLLISLFSFGQNQIQNQGFEQWDDLGQDEEEPKGWSSFMNAEDNGLGILFSFTQNQKIERTTDTRPGTTGDYSGRIWSTSVVGNVANGTVTTGRIYAGSTTPTNSANHNRTKRSNGDYNQPFTGSPDSLAIWVKYNASGGNQARISATIHDDYDYRDPSDSDPAAPDHVVAKAVLNFAPTSGWTRLSIPFDYNFPSSDAQYILITITTNATPGGGSSGDEVFFDDLEFIYAPQVDIAPTTTQNLIENQTGTILTATENQTVSSREWKFSTFSGGGYQSFGTAETATTYTPLFATAGTYYVVCESNFGGAIVLSNEVQINVNPFSNSIAPNTTQVVFQNQQGNELTVTESPTATSREWKYSTTSGSGYTSFASAETNTTYTPLFLNTGTYYVVCESTLGGETAISNEVEITVNVSSTPSISITPTSAQNIEVNQDGTTLTANETITPSAREWKYSTTSGSGYTSFASAEVSNTYTPNFANDGVYYIVCFSTMSGTEYMSNEVEITVNDISISISPSPSVLAYENLPGDTLFAIESQPATSREWKISTESGTNYQSFSTPITDDFYIPLFNQAGTYFVICEAEINGIIKVSNEVGIVVNNGPTMSISPSGNQDIYVDEAGTTLNLNTAGFVASSQEWKYGTESGGPYNTFATAEVSTSYTPLFDTEGEYYVICEGIFSGQMLSSNEVRINVSEEPVSIIEVNEPNFSVFSNNQILYIDLSTTNLGNDASVEIVSIDGKIIAVSSLENYTMNTIELDTPQGIYIANIIAEEKSYQVKFNIQ